MAMFPKCKRYLKIMVTTSDSARFLSRIAENGISVQYVKWLDVLRFTGVVTQNEFNKLEILQQKYGDKIEILSKYGLFWHIYALLRRPVILIGMLIFLLISLSLPGRILFIQTEGNIIVPDALLIEQAARSGIKFGSKSKKIRSEKVKNRLLSDNTMLQWVGIDFSGCVATIHVRERSTIEQRRENREVKSIVAGFGGIVSRITATQGTPLCRIGEQVNAGDVLISGYTDCGLKVQAGTASGEVFAYTLRQISAVLPEATARKGNLNSVHRCIQLKIGKKLIYFCNHSGILYATCDKMYVEKYCTLPGGFCLPISIVIVDSIDYGMNPANPVHDSVKQWLADFSAQYLCNQMVAGKILGQDHFFSLENGCARLNGTYICEEMIGQERLEGIRMQYAEDY